MIIGKKISEELDEKNFLRKPVEQKYDEPARLLIFALGLIIGMFISFALIYGGKV